MKDPVCGMEVAEPPKIQTAWNNHIYGFCNPGCLDKFKKEPEKYLNEKPNGMPEEPVSKLKIFMPLIVVLSTVLAVSFGAEIYFGEWQLMRWMQNFMAAFFIVFGGLKLTNWKGFVEAYQTYDIVAKRSAAYAHVYPLIELSLGVSYLFRWNAFLTNLVTVIVMFVGAIGVAQALRKKQKIQCACLGVLFKIPMTKITLMEDLLMGLMALAMLFLNHGF